MSAVHAGLEARPSWSPEAPARGETLSVQVSFVNVGNESSPPGVARVTLNGVEVASNELPSLAPGRRTTIVARPASVGEGDSATLEVLFRAEGGEETLERRDVLALAAPTPATTSAAAPATTPPPTPDPTPAGTPVATPPSEAPPSPARTPLPWGLVVLALAAVGLARRRP